jgi:hypothetical protein
VEPVNNVRSGRQKRSDVLDTLYFAASNGATVGAVGGAVLGAIAGLAFAIWALKLGGYTPGLFVFSIGLGAVGGAAAGAVAGTVVSTAVAAVTVAPYSYFFGKPRCVDPRPRNLFSGLRGFFTGWDTGPAREPSCSDMLPSLFLI